MKFSKLRLTGFKSFVDPTELVIEQGITGIVGPNGCGKSNLVEALRWVMGETSAKRMRGSEMDDVIFGGTTARPARNLAEVVLEVDNSRRTAPAIFNHFDSLEIRRKIERGAGSDYRVNGKSVRARDVQILFQDNGSGAGSAALVSQGRVGALIAAKPTERRLLLEEAAGITGLHSRRHEAELRLKAAEANLVRLEDVIGAMETQLAGLRKQARQAARYRNLSERIRATEAIVLHLRWRAAQAALDEARRAYEENEAAVRDRMLGVSGSTTEEAEAAAAVPPLREKEAAAGAALQRLAVAREGLEAEERRIRDAQAETSRRLEQIEGDLKRERGLSADAAEALDRLARERDRIGQAQAGEEEREAKAESALAGATAEIESLDSELTALTEKVAADEAERQSRQRETTDLQSRVQALLRRQEDIDRQRAALEKEIAESADVAAAEAEAIAAEGAVETARTAAEAAETARQAAEAERTEAEEGFRALDSALARLTAEAEALAGILAGGNRGDHPPLIDSVTVEPGYEAAFGAALGDDSELPADPAAQIHWSSPPAYENVAALPDGTEPLAGRVKAPAALARRLAHIGVATDSTTAEGLAESLLPGQQIVSRDGGHWRWDGLRAAPGSPSAAAARLEQRNRLAGLRREKDRMAAETEAARARRDGAKARATEAREAEQATRRAMQDAFSRLNAARDRHAKLTQADSGRRSRLSALIESLDGIAADRKAAEADLGKATDALAALPDTAAQRTAIADRRAALADRRAVQAEKRNALETLRREAGGRRNRLRGIETDEKSWRDRAAGTSDRLGELQSRADEARRTLSGLESRPAELAAQREGLIEEIEAAEKNCSVAADALAAAETRLSEAGRALKSAEAALAEAREARVRGEAEVRAAMTALDAVRDRIAERLDCPPERTAAIAGIDPTAPLPDEKEHTDRLERLIREREGMGPVNLRAEVEATELETQIAAMIQERDDLVAAIARLRQGIASLNKEARERLLAAFDVVDGHFRELFVKLFGGGQAELKLTDAEDPLNAGLEIFASPPGKKLQHLSLLSGGEQALTALSLLFGVFLTNPSPICVLDEVDAPLDDANVDRFCSMLEQLVRDEVTRFLVITHHRMTMARVDRLYGVTMRERGVSQLVSVDLQRAETMRQTSLALA
ncbi:chromosome segregation protein SMC [Inquilinus sp. CAU 1745]|uniref:chromosome segregation protein SMC n=1 Tax=Inquilinus sp. CAU 1745 TaxID=3140369 RepID=UPI00325B4D95